MVVFIIKLNYTKYNNQILSIYIIIDKVQSQSDSSSSEISSASEKKKMLTKKKSLKKRIWSNHQLGKFYIY